MPEILFIEIKDYIGPQYFSDAERKNWIPINVKSAYCQQLNATRTQFPLRLAYAMTIHKAQGLTLKAVIDLGICERSLGLTFVALSRVKKFTDLLIQPFSFDRLKNINNSTNLIPRLEEEARLEKLILDTNIVYSELFN